MQQLHGNIFITSPPDPANLILDDSQDTTGQTAMFNDDGTTGTVTGLSPATISYADALLSSLTADGGSGGNTFNINGTLANSSFPATPTTLNTGTGHNTVNVDATNAHSLLAIQGQGVDTADIGSAGTLTTILSPVSVTAPTGTAALNIDDHADQSNNAATLDNLSGNVNAPFEVTGLSLAPIEYGIGVSAVNITGGTSALGEGGPLAGVIFDINDTQDGTTTTINGGANQNFFNLSNATESGGLDNLLGPVVVNGGTSGTDVVTLDDSSRNSAANKYIITATTVSGGIFFGGLTYSTIGTLTLNSENNPSSDRATIDINNTADGVTTNVNGQGSNAAISVNSTGTLGTLNVSTGASASGNFTTVGVAADNEPVNITPGSPGDAIIIGVTGGDGAGTMAGILGPIGITSSPNCCGPPNLYSLHFHDENDATGRTWTLNNDDGSNNAAVALSGGIATTTFRPGDLNSASRIFGGSHGNTFNVNSTTGFQSTSLFTGTGDDTVNVFATGNNFLDIDGQDGADTVTLGALASVGMQHLTGTIVVTNALDSINHTVLTTLILDDSQDSTGQTGTLTDNGTTGAVNGLSPALITYTDAGISGLTIDQSSAGANTFMVNGTLVDASITNTSTTLNKGSGSHNVVDVFATTLGSVLSLTGTGTSDTVNLGQNGSVASLKGTVNINEATASTKVVVNLSNDVLAHTLDLSSNGTTSTLHDQLGNLPADITYTTVSLASLEIDTDGAANQTLNLNFGGGGNPIPTASPVGLIYNAGSPAAGVSSARTSPASSPRAPSQARSTTPTTQP